MALDVNEIRQTVNKIYRKNQVGGYLDTATYNRYAEKAQLAYFQKRIKAFESTREVTQDVQSLKTQVFLPAVKTDRIGAVVAQPSDFWEVDSITTSAGYSQDGSQKSTRVQVTEMTDMDFDFAASSEAFKPNSMFPVFKIFGGNIIVLPEDTDEIGLSYIKYPTPPEWVGTVSGSRETYDSANSTQFTVPDDGFDEIVDMILVDLGVSTRDEMVTGYGIQAQDVDGK